MSARSVLLSALAVAALAPLGPLAASAAPTPTGMDEVGNGVLVDVCGRTPCADLGAAGTASGKPFAAATLELRVHNATGTRPAPGQCVKATFGFGLVQQADTFRADGQGKLCAASDGTATVSGKYSGGGVVGDATWSWGSGQGTMTAVVAVDGRISFRATGSYALSPLK